MMHQAVRVGRHTWRPRCNTTEDHPCLVHYPERVSCQECLNPIPEYARLIGGDNRPVSVPRWLAIDLLDLVRRFLMGKPRSTVPCFMAEEQDNCDTFEQLIEEVQ